MRCSNERKRTIWQFVIVKKMDVSFSCVCPVIDNEFWHSNVKVVCGSTRGSTADPHTATLTTLWRNLWSITQDRRIKTDVNLLNRITISQALDSLNILITQTVEHCNSTPDFSDYPISKDYDKTFIPFGFPSRFENSGFRCMNTCPSQRISFTFWKSSSPQY